MDRSLMSLFYQSFIESVRTFSSICCYSSLRCQTEKCCECGGKCLQENVCWYLTQKPVLFNKQLSKKAELIRVDS